MKIWSHVQIRLLILLFMSLQARGTEAEHDFKKDAEEAFPHTHTIPFLADLKATFHPLMEPEIREIFNANFSIMFRKDFPKPKHPIAAIVGGFRCLYVKMATAHALGDEQAKKELQLEALNQLLALHKDLIALFDEDLARQITGFGCANCMASAKIALGMEDEHSGYQKLQQPPNS